MTIELTQNDVDTLFQIAHGCGHVGANEAARLIILGYLIEQPMGWESTLPLTCVDTSTQTIHLCMTTGAMRVLKEVRQEAGGRLRRSP